ncbi:cyclase family protein [Yinghuangia sp. ASG 101]|uniref:cyclase family protein n=1 Tax=Yinghuangia sp. ASG 101 TaxID=2896848 RepID=UPI001E55BAD9|nr:cyclase family protein [Yinghuangia sp. ASG 101]UGQ08918.1 cyclase family protein [Yinghuangia sp. ASG 101]
MAYIDGYRLASSRVLDLAQPMRTGMPQSANHPPFRVILERRHGDYVRGDGGSAADEVIVTSGHIGTHVDALGHVSHNGVAHGGVAASAIQGYRGLSSLGIENFTPYLGRAVVLDVARLHGVDVLPAGYEITADDLSRAEALAGSDVRSGEAVLIGTGWSRLWDQYDVFTGLRAGVPGPGPDAAYWLASRRVRVVGGESLAFERIGPGLGETTYPVHRILLVEAGINIVETMRLHELLDSGCGECLLILAPLPIVGATGAPVRPLAVIPG